MVKGMAEKEEMAKGMEKWKMVDELEERQRGRCIVYFLSML